MAVAKRLFTSLSENGIVVDSETDDIILSEEFQEAISRTRDQLSGSESAELAEEIKIHSAESVRNPLLDLRSDYPEFVACFLETVRRIPELSPEEQVKITAIVQQLQSGFPPSSGTPDGFFPVAGNQLEPLLQLNEKAVVYVWREDCEPCDLVRDDLEAVLDEQPDDIALLSVYGPDCARFLQEKYEVVAGPTVLFVIQGTVDARLQRAHPKPSYEAEIQYLREYEIS